MTFRVKKKYIIVSVLVVLIIGIMSYLAVANQKNKSLTSDKIKNTKSVVASKNSKDEKKPVDKTKEQRKVDESNIEAEKNKNVTQNRQVSTKNNLSVKKQSKSVLVKKTEKTIISDEQIKSLLNNGYMIQRQLENKYVTLQSVQIGDKYYVNLSDRFKNRESIYNYCGTQFGLSRYYTNRYVKAIVDCIVKDINGKYYGLLGQSGQYINLKTARITSKNYKQNRIYITFDATAEDGSWSHYRGVLVKARQRWLIDSCNFLLDV